MKIALLRHGRTAWNAAGRLQGRTDIPLTPEDRAHLDALALPPPWREAAVIASPLARAKDTAEALTRGPVTTHPALVEMDLGAWEGQRGIDLLTDPNSGYTHVEQWGWDGGAPGGETPRALLARVLPVVEGLERNTVIVCHINIMRVLLARAYGWNFDGAMPFRIKRDRLYILHRDENGWHAEAEPVRLVPR